MPASIAAALLCGGAATASRVALHRISGPDEQRQPMVASPRAPDGALWFTEVRATRSGGSRPRGSITEYAIPPRQPTHWHHHGPGRRAVVHRAWRQQDRADHDRRGVYRIRRSRPAEPAQGITAGPDGALWFTERRQQDRADHDRRDDYRIHCSDQRRLPGTSPRGRTARCGSPKNGDKIGRITTGGRVTEYAVPTPAAPCHEHHRGAGRRAVVHRMRRQQDRADHDRRGRHRIHRSHNRAAAPDGIAAGPDGALWFTEHERQQDRADHDRRR